MHGKSGTLRGFAFTSKCTCIILITRFLDAQTQTITVALVCFSPEHGLASTISITAQLGSSVSVDFAVAHFQSLEGEPLETYKWVCIAGFVLAGVNSCGCVLLLVFMCLCA